MQIFFILPSTFTLVSSEQAERKRGCVSFPRNRWGHFIGIKSNTLPETNIAPGNGWLEYDRFLLGWPIFRGFHG